MKQKWILFSGVLLIMAGLVMTGCGGGGSDDIGWSAAADGSADAASTKITFAFDKEVTGLAAGDITIVNGTGEAAKGALTGSGKAWVLAISGVKSGTVSVSIAKGGIKTATATVTVFGGTTGPVQPTSYDYYFEPSRVNFFFDEMTPPVTLVTGKNYDIKVAISALDDGLAGGHFGGMLVYFEDEADNETRVELAGWINGTPDTIAGEAQNYTWRFMNIGTIPDDVRLRFSLVAKKTWSDDFPADSKLGFNAVFSVTEFVPPSLVLKTTIDDTYSAWNWDDTEHGNGGLKGKLDTTLSAQIMGYEEGKVIVFYEGTIGANGFSAANGIGAIGQKGFNSLWWSDDSSRGDYLAPDTLVQETVDIWIKDMVLESDNTLLVNVYNGATITKIEVWGMP